MNDFFQIESIKHNLGVQIDNLLGEIEKFQVMWEQFKPQETKLHEGRENILIDSLAIIREKRQKWMDILQNRDELL